MSIPAYNPVAVNNANIVTFISTDPLGLGFAAIRTAHPGQDQPLIEAAIVVSADYQIPSSPMSPADFQELYNANELASFSGPMLDQLQLMYAAGAINIGSRAIGAQLDALFADFPLTLANVQTRYTRPGTAWEYYFGAGHAPTTALLDSARNSGAGSNF